MSEERIPYRGGRVCRCLLTVFPLAEEEMLIRGLIKERVDVFQWSYSGAAASAGTHLGGGALDCGQYTPDQLHVWRSWGVEMQDRSPFFALDHGHGIVKGCSHLSASARDQARSWENGRNGLVSNGPITGPGPKGSDTPTWRQALDQRKKILVALKDDIASEVVAQLRKEYKDIAAVVLGRDVVPNTFTSNNVENPTVSAATALKFLGADNDKLDAKLDQILARLPKEN